MARIRDFLDYFLDRILMIEHHHLATRNHDIAYLHVVDLQYAFDHVEFIDSEELMRLQVF